MRVRLVYALAWLLATAVAVSVGLFAVRTIGDAAAGRGPLGNEIGPPDSRGEGVRGRPGYDPSAPLVTRELRGEYGSFTVSCRGAYAIGSDAAAASGWDVIRYEPGPDDDVDAVFSSATRSVEVDVFCNQGEPTVSEIERSELPDD